MESTRAVKTVTSKDFLLGRTVSVRHTTIACKPAYLGPDRRTIMSPMRSHNGTHSVRMRYRWRHGRVLAVLSDSLEKERKQKRVVGGKQNYIQFVRADQSKPAVHGDQQGFLHQAVPWEMKADLRKKLVFSYVVHTSLRPDIDVWSETSRKNIMIELTIPGEDACEEVHKRKSIRASWLL